MMVLDIKIYIREVFYEFFIISFYIILFLNDKFIIKYNTLPKWW
jgi:hypothetical protein